MLSSVLRRRRIRPPCQRRWLRGRCYQTLTTLSIGPNVKTIGASAFANTKLTTLTVPEGVESIGDRAFAGNPVTVAYIDSNAVPGVDAFLFGGTDFYDLFLECVYAMDPPYQTLQDLIPCYNQAVDQARPTTDEFARIYTPYPEHYASGFAQQEETTYSGLLGVPAPTLRGGAVLVNPGWVQTAFRSTDGTEVSPSTTRVGPQLTDYKVSSAYALKPDLTDTDLASLYYLQGNTFSVVPPTIDGYRTPASYSGVLSAQMTLIEFVYARSTIGASSGILRPIVTLHSLEQNIDAGEAPTEQGWPVPSLEEVEEFNEHLASLPKSSGKSFGTVLGEWITKHPALTATGVGIVAGIPAAWWLIGALRRRRNDAN